MEDSVEIVLGPGQTFDVIAHNGKLCTIKAVSHEDFLECDRKMRSRLDREEFNCSEDYFKDVTGDNLPKGDTAVDCPYRTHKCKLCGWSVMEERFVSCFAGEGSLFRSNISDKMRDHVYLKHN